MGKKNAFVTTIGFNKNDPAHVQVAEFLNGMERGKAQYIVNAVLAYQNGGQAAGIPAGQTVDYERIRQFVLQVMREYEGRETSYKETAAEPARLDAGKDKTGMVFGFDEDTLDGIMSSLEAFRGKTKGSQQVDLFSWLPFPK